MMLFAILLLCASTVSAFPFHPFVAPFRLTSPTDLTKRQAQTTKPDATSYYTLSTIGTGEKQCLYPIPGVDGSVPYPVRFSPCDSLQDDKLWQFTPDGAGLYFVYNKAWPGTSKRLDINCPQPTLCIMWMGPSDEKYNNQRWSLQSQTAGSIKISSLGLPEWLMTSGTADGNTVAFLQNTTTASSNQQVLWKLATLDKISTSTTAAAPALSTTAPGRLPSSPSTKTTTSVKTEISTVTTSDSAGRPPGTSPTQTHDPSSTQATTPAPTPAPANEKEGGNWDKIGAIGGAVGAGAAVLTIIITAPATFLKLLTCGRRGRQSNKEVRTQMGGAIRKSMIRLPWNNRWGAAKVSPGGSPIPMELRHRGRI